MNIRFLSVAAAVILATSVPAAAQDERAADVLRQTRQALGGERLDAVKALSVEGPFRREMGGGQMQGTLAITIQLPDHMHRSEDMELPGGMSVERTSALAGETTWEDMRNRGGMGGGMIMMRGGPQELNPQQVEEARLRRLRTELTRYLFVFFGGADLQPTHVAVAEAPDGKADVLELKDDRGQTLRVFIDQQTHLPLMLQYQEIRPRINMTGRGGRGPGGGRGQGRPPDGPPPARGEGERPDPEEIRRRVEAMGALQPSQVTLYLSEYKPVDGVMLPHQLTQAVDGKPAEEWTIDKARLNPAIRADFFQKK